MHGTEMATPKVDEATHPVNILTRTVNKCWDVHYYILLPCSNNSTAVGPKMGGNYD